MIEHAATCHVLSNRRGDGYGLVYSEDSVWPCYGFNITSSAKVEEICIDLESLHPEVQRNTILFQRPEVKVVGPPKFGVVDRWIHMERSTDLAPHKEMKYESVTFETCRTVAALKEWSKVASCSLFSGKRINEAILYHMSLSKSTFIAGRMAGEMVCTAMVHVDDVGMPGLYMISVLPEFRKHGVGYKLMNYVFEMLNSEGYLHCVLQSTKAGYRLYSGLGFVSDSYVNLCVLNS